MQVPVIEKTTEASALLVQFAKYPQLGRVKTRMQPVLSPPQSLELHQALLEHNLARLSRSSRYDFQLALAGTPDAQARAKIKRWQQIYACASFQQQGDDLGQRMAHAIEQGFKAGYKKVVIIGSDCPFIDTVLLEQTLALLDHQPLVLNPALDGGYVLIAQTKLYPTLFQRIDWGCEKVLAQTQAAAAELGLQPALLAALADIDRPEDLALLPGQMQQRVQQA